MVTINTNSFEIIAIDGNDWTMECVKFGSGKRSFVIIPGISMKPIKNSAGAIANAYKSFCSNYTVYVFDRRTNMQPGYSVREMARDTAFAMDRFGIKDADIFGASQGGMIAQYIAIDYPSLVHKLVLGSTISRQNKTSLSTFSCWIKFAKEKDFCAINHDMFQKIYSDEFLEKYKSVIPILEKDGSPEECERFEILSKAVLDFDCYDEAKKIKCPVLVLGAKNDKVLSGKGSTEIAEKLGCEIYMYENFGHAVYDEAPDYKERMINFFLK